MPFAYNSGVTGFTKLFSTIIHSTVWREEMHIKVVWITMLAMADRNGRVLASMPGLADASRVSLDQCVEALARLASPDKHSRSKEHEGRRIEEIDGGWQLLNYLKYREQRDSDERRIQTRAAVQRHREKKAEPLTVSRGKPEKAQAEAEAEAENVSTEAPTYQLPPDLKTEKTLRDARWRDERSLLAAVGRIAERTGKEATEVMEQVTAYKRRDGTRAAGRKDPALLRSHEAVEKSLADALAWEADLDAGLEAVP